MMGGMMGAEAIQDEALHFIQVLDSAAFEAFIIGDISPERYRELAEHIGIIQRLIVDILENSKWICRLTKDDVSRTNYEMELIRKDVDL
jgi:hypothetical protein